ncbi:MAG: transposase [Myxococcota bacterium]
MKTLLVGVDWGREHVQFVAEEEDEERVLWKDRSRATPKAIDVVLRHIRRLAEQNDVSLVRVAIEQKASRLVEALMDAGFEVWFVRPQQVDLLRELMFSSKAKDDLRDARAMVGLLRSMRSALVRLEVAPARASRAALPDESSQESGRRSDRAAEQASEHVPRLLPGAAGDRQASNAQWFTSLRRLVRTPAGARATSLDDIRSLLKASRVRKITPEEVHARLVEATDYCGQGDWTLVVELEPRAPGAGAEADQAPRSDDRREARCHPCGGAGSSRRGRRDADERGDHRFTAGRGARADVGDGRGAASGAHRGAGGPHGDRGSSRLEDDRAAADEATGNRVDAAGLQSVPS